MTRVAALNLKSITANLFKNLALFSNNHKASLASRTLQEFIAGAVIGASLSTIFYPMNVIKVSMQSEMGHKREKMWTVCQRIYYERGGRISYFFRGCGFNAFRSFMSWGVMNTAYEKIKEVIT